MKDRDTDRVAGQVVEATDAPTLQRFVRTHTDPGAKVYTDDAAAYIGIPRSHETVRHSVGEYVRGMAHTNGVESFWALLKRGYVGTYHKMSTKHLQRYVMEFAGRANDRDLDTVAQMSAMVSGSVGKRLRYVDLTGPRQTCPTEADLMARRKRPRGRPVEKPMPPRIDATPERIAQVVLSAPPPDRWGYELDAKKQEAADDDRA